METDTKPGPGWVPAIVIIVAVGLILRWLAFAPYDISHADELMQYLEQAKRLATGQGIVPWEYRYGLRNALIPQLLSVPYAIGHWLAPDTPVAMLAVRWTFVALSLLVLPAAWLLGAATSRRHALVALAVAAGWHEIVLFSDLLLSETLATALIALGTALLVGERRGQWALVWAGILLGLGVIVRLQYAPFCLVLALLSLRTDWRSWQRLVLGGLIAVAIGVASDLAMARVPFAWVWENFSFNIFEGRAARFGKTGPFEYVAMIFGHLGVLALPVFAGAALAPARYRPVFWALLVNIVLHSLIAHKEYRFIWLSMFLALMLAAIASVSFADWLAVRRGRWVGALWLAGLCAVWLAGSMLTERISGGARAMRGGAPIPLAAIEAQKGGACGIALPDQWRAHLVPALLPGPTPIYIAPKAVMAGSMAMPGGVVRSANAMVFPPGKAPAPDYARGKCFTNGAIDACVYRRPGACSPDGHWRYQSALEREDL